MKHVVLLITVVMTGFTEKKQALHDVMVGCLIVLGSISAVSTAKSSAPRPSPLTAGENQLLWTLWLTYGAFYFCRTNIFAAVPGLEAGLELSKTQIGFILGALKIAYGLGQCVNGQLAEKHFAA